MFKRLRTTWMAGSGALLLVLSLSGVVAGASFLAATGPAQESADPGVVDAEKVLNDADCEVVAPAPDAIVTTPNAHGTWISQVAQSDAIGGKNCNHGGAVSEANKAAREAREVAKEAKAAERDAAKAERAAKRAAARAERSAAKADKPSKAAKADKPSKAAKAERSAKSAAARAERSAAKADKPSKAAKAKSAGH